MYVTFFLRAVDEGMVPDWLRQVATRCQRDQVPLWGDIQ